MIKALEVKYKFTTNITLDKITNDIKGIFQWMDDNYDKYKFFSKIAFHKLKKYTYEANPKIIKKWNIANIIPHSIDLDNQDFYKLCEYPRYNDKDVYKMLFASIFIYLQAMMGLGKTEIMVNIVSKTIELDPKKTILIIVPRTSLCDNFATRYNRNLPLKEKFYMYKDCTNE